jgi:flagellin
MVINHNISAVVTQTSLYQAGLSLSKSLQKLSTGLRINSAADDAAGLGVSENLRTQVNGLGQAMKNTQDAISLLNIADGALNEQSSILQRMRELVVQALNDTYTSTERSYMGVEFVQLRNELDRIAAATNFNGMEIFAAPQTTMGAPIYGVGNFNSDAPRETHYAGYNGTYLFPNDPLFGRDDVTSGHHFNMFIGANYDAADAAAFQNNYNWWNQSAADMITIQFGQMDANGILSINPAQMQASTLFESFGFSLARVSDQQIAIGAWQSGDVANPNLATVKDKLKLLLRIVDGSRDVPSLMKRWVFGASTQNGTYSTGIQRVNQMRSRIGAMVNRLEHSITNTQTMINNSQAAESLIRDADFAKEAAAYMKNQILTKSATAMLAQANSQTSYTLRLIKQ